MQEKIQKFMKIYGYKGLILLLLHPILVIPLTLYALIGSLINIIKALSKGDWHYLSGNTTHTAFNNYFYYIQSLNIQKFGRYGVSSLVGGGRDFSLKNWFHTMPFALRIQSHFGTVMMLFFAMIFWCISVFVIADFTWQNILIIMIAFSSTYFFANFIDRQNYNILAWMLLPLSFYTLFEHSYLLYGLIIFAMSFFSFTAIFIFGIITFVFGLYWQDFYIILAIVPATIKVAIPVLVSFKEGALKKMGGAIGVHDKVKYKRSDKKIDILFLYILALSLFFIGWYIFKFGIDQYFILQMIFLLLFIVNSIFLRFADKQTIYMIFLSVFCFSLLNKELDLITVIIYTLSINPFYFMLGCRPATKIISPDIRNPVNTKELIEHIASIAKKMGNKKRFLFLFNNPKNQYSNIFDGYKVIIEPIAYALQKNGSTIFPDWYYCFENNKESNTDLIWWNQDADLLKESIKLFDVDYILTYQGIFKNEKIDFLEKVEEIYIKHIDKNLIFYKVC